MIKYLLLLVLCGCTINLLNTSTNGKSSDVVDTEQAQSPNVNPELSIP